MSEPASTPVGEPTSTPAPSADSGGFIDAIGAFFDAPADPTAPEPSAPDPAKPEPASPEPAKSEPSPTEPSDPLASLDDVEPKDWTPQAARRFKELKAELKTFKTRSEELEALAAQKETRLQELEALANNPEYQQLQDRIAEYERKMLVTNLEQSHAYQTLVEQPLAQLVSEADAIAEKYSVEANSLFDAIALDDEAAQEEQLGELLANASDRDKFRIYKIIEEIKPILDQRRMLQENAQAALQEAEELDRTRSQAELASRAQQRQEAATAVADKLKAKIPFLTGVEGVDLSAIASSAASVDPASLDPVTGTYQAMAAQLLPKMAKQYLELQKEIDSLTERLAAYDKATPKASGGSPSAAGPSSASDGKSFLDAVTSAFGG